jgi:ferrous iron transport protein A
MGLRPGKQVEMITNRGSGPLVLRVDECRIAMGRGAAMKIYVRDRKSVV